MGEYDKAKQQYDLVMSGKGMEISNKKGKGKVSLQNQVRRASLAPPPLSLCSLLSL